MIMRTNIQFKNGYLAIPSLSNEVDILCLKPSVSEDGGFIFYDDNDNEVCYIGIRTDRKPCEISYGTQIQFRGKGYMQEALTFLLQFFSRTISLKKYTL